MVEISNYIPNIGDPTTAGLVFIGIIALGITSIVVLFFVLYVAKFKIRIDMEERRGNNVVESRTRGGIIKNKKTGVKEFRVWRSKWNPFNYLVTAPPPSDMYRIDKKGRPILRIFKDSVDTFKLQRPVKPQTLKDRIRNPLSGRRPSEEGTELTYLEPANKAEMPAPVDLEWFSWAAQTLKALAPRYRNDKGWLAENKDLIAFGGVLFVFLAATIFVWNFWTDGSANLASTAASVKETQLSHERTARILHGGEQIPAAQGGVDRNTTNTQPPSGNFVQRIATREGGGG